MDGSVVFTRLRQCAPLFNTWFPGLIPFSIPNGILIGSALFCKTHGTVSLDFTVGRPFFCSKLPICMGGSGPHLIRGSLGLPKFTYQTTSQSVQSFCRADDCDRQTDRPCCSVCYNRPHDIVLQQNLIMVTIIIVNYNLYSTT